MHFLDVLDAVFVGLIWGATVMFGLIMIPSIMFFTLKSRVGQQLLFGWQACSGKRGFIGFYNWCLNQCGFNLPQGFNPLTDRWVYMLPPRGKGLVAKAVAFLLGGKWPSIDLSDDNALPTMIVVSRSGILYFDPPFGPPKKSGQMVRYGGYELRIEAPDQTKAEKAYREWADRAATLQVLTYPQNYRAIREIRIEGVTLLFRVVSHSYVGRDFNGALMAS
ncbi:MAG: hypothetical protein HW405_358 [Candidatus Berkelbacteria bacterium]|nr:hypothetical protein [Candidatus Berkelbacteria bacterium]